MRRRPATVLALSVLAGLLDAGAAVATVRVVTSIPPLAMIVAEVGGDRVDARSLMPAGADPHTFEPKPSDARRVADADVVVVLGSEIDDWIEEAIASASGPGRAAVVRLDPTDHHGDEGHGEHDLHVWLDPRWVRDRAVPAVHLALATADPAGAAAYGVKARAAREKISDLEDDIREALEKAPTRNFFSWHPAWGAFAGRFGLHPVASLGEGEGMEPSLMAMGQAVRAIRAAGVRAVLVEPQVDRRRAEVLADEVGLPVLVADPIGDAWSLDRSTYMLLMHYNLTVFERALGIEKDEDEEEGAGAGKVSGLASSPTCQ